MPAAFQEPELLAELGVTDLDAQCADRVVDDLGLVGAKENQIAAFSTGLVEQRLEGFIVDVLDDRRLQPFTTLGRHR